MSHLNIRSVFNKFDVLRVFLESRNRAMIFGMSETWLDDFVSNDEVQIPGFNIYRKDRNR